MTKKFTKKQIENWEEYEEQRLDGSYNMFDRRAREMTSLTQDEWLFCMKNYTELKTQAVHV